MFKFIDRLFVIYMVFWCYGEGYKYVCYSILGMKNSVVKIFFCEVLYEGFILCKLWWLMRKIIFSYVYLYFLCFVLEIKIIEKWLVFKYFYYFLYFC